MKYLWVNLCDLSDIGNIPVIGSPLNLMIREDLGDTLLPGAYYDHGLVDECYVVIESSPERCGVIQDGIELVGEQKMGRRTRTRITASPPGEKWIHVPGR